MGLTETILETYTYGLNVVFIGLLTIVVLHDDTLYKNFYCSEKRQLYFWITHLPFVEL